MNTKDERKEQEQPLLDYLAKTRDDLVRDYLFNDNADMLRLTFMYKISEGITKMNTKDERKEQEKSFYDELFTQKNLFRGYLFEEETDILKHLFM